MSTSLHAGPREDKLLTNHIPLRLFQGWRAISFPTRMHPRGTFFPSDPTNHRLDRGIVELIMCLNTRRGRMKGEGELEGG